MLAKHTFNAEGKHLGSGLTVEGRPPVAPAKGWVVVDNNLAEYPYPVRMKEGVVQQDDTVEAVKGKWQKKKVSKVARLPASDVAFGRLVGAFSVAGSYPEKHAAMTKAVKALGDEATADELYEASVANLSKVDKA